MCAEIRLKVFLVFYNLSSTTTSGLLHPSTVINAKGIGKMAGIQMVRYCCYSCFYFYLILKLCICNQNMLKHAIFSILLTITINKKSC